MITTHTPVSLSTGRFPSFYRFFKEAFWRFVERTSGGGGHRPKEERLLFRTVPASPACSLDKPPKGLFEKAVERRETTGT